MGTVPTGRVDEEPIDTLRSRLVEAEEMLRAIREGAIDALVVETADGSQVYTLHSAEEPYRNLLEQMQEGAVVLSSRGDIVYSNARFAALVGEPLESVVGGPFRRFVSPSERDGLEALLAVGGGRRRSRLIGAGSGVIEVSLSVTSTVSASGNRLNLIVTDLSELFEANSNRARAERDNRTKDDFLAMLAHELRNPLGAISAAVQVLESARAVGTRATHAHQVIARQVHHISSLIDDLLDVERVVSGRIRLNRQPLDVRESVRQAVVTFTDDAQLDRQIDTAFTTEPLWIEGDHVRLQQVLTNLLTNAVKYTPSGGRIRIALRDEGGDAVLTVEDSGFGISPRLLPFIFDLYVQADRTLDRARGGLGIGLTLVRRLVELHGGTIDASSAGEGRGSLFTVRLRQMHTVERASDLSVPTERRTRPRRVLLIEDSQEGREKLRTMLELAGHVVYDAASGAQGLELMNAARPDVGIIDVSLPMMDGYQVARRIREAPHGRGMLLVALTGHGSGTAPRMLEPAFDHHLAKPIDLDYLVRLISESAEGS